MNRTNATRTALGALVLATLLGGSSEAQRFGQQPPTSDPMERYRNARDGATVRDWEGRLRDPRVDVRLAAVRSLGESEDPLAVEPLIVAAGDADERVAVLAVDYLGKRQAVVAGDFLAEQLFLRKTSSALRHHILSALGQIRDPGTSRAVLDFLRRGEDPPSRGAAFFALGEIGDTMIETELAEIAERETDPQLKKIAGDALEKINGRRFVPATPGPTPSTNPFLRPLE